MSNCAIAFAACCFFVPVDPVADSPGERMAVVAHLPDLVQQDILAWQQRLMEARCLKIVCDTDQTWVNLHEIDDAGQPVMVLRERFRVHSWMTPEMSFLVVYPYEGDEPATRTPHLELLWLKAEGRVWERQWMPDHQVHRVRTYPTPARFGPENSDFYSRGCLHGALMESWLAGGSELSERAETVHSVALMRSPNLAAVPPEPAARGVWLDVFKSDIVRDEDAGPEVYRRRDFMLLTRDSENRPCVGAWRTQAVTDRKGGGRTPQQITATNRFEYVFHDEAPVELLKAVAAFRGTVERGAKVSRLERGSEASLLPRE